MTDWKVESSTGAQYAQALRAEAEAARRGELKTRRLDEIAAELGLDA